MNRITDAFISNLNRSIVCDLYSNKSLDYKDLFSKAYGLSKYLIKIGIKKKTKIIVITNNTLLKFIFFFSSMINNYHLILFDDLENPKNLKKLIKKFNLNYIFVDKRNINIISKNKYYKGSHYIIKDRKFFFNLDKIQDLKFKNLPKILKELKIDLNLPFLTILTSGTTGIPKGIVHNLKSLINSAENFNKFNKINNKCVMAHFFSMNYMAGILNTIISPFLAGGKIILFEKFNSLSGLTFWEKAIDNKVNYFWTSPTMLSLIIKLNRYPGVKSYVKKYLEKIFIGTAQLPKNQKIFFKKFFLNKVYESYGTTEDLFISCDDESKRYDTSGKILPNVKILISEKKKIFIKTNSPNLGVYELKKLKTIKRLNNWRDTGDIGELIKNRYLKIIGRDKDIIIKGGKNIYPVKIENLIYSVDNIKQVAVVGMKNQLYGEDIVIFYNTSEKINKKIFENNLMKICDKNLPKDYKPSKFIYKKIFEITKTGKIKKNKLKLS